MGRAPRVDVGNMVYHVLNRANQRQRIFYKQKDYQAFEKILFEAKKRHPMRILAFCLMPNHWHMVVYPQQDGDLSKFMQWLTLTHTQRWHAHYKSIGLGHLYQGRYKSFLIQTDEHFWQVVRYVERNSVRARLVSRIEQWRWSSAWIRKNGNSKHKGLLSKWPVEESIDYFDWANRTLPYEQEQIDAIRASIKKSRPYGSGEWVSKNIKKFGLEVTLREPGRPKKKGT